MKLSESHSIWWLFWLLVPIAFTACSRDVKVAVQLPEDNVLPEVVDFNFHVRPILSDRCYFCHGPDDNDRKAGLRLDTKEGAFSALEDGGFAIVAGKHEKSAIFQRLVTDNEEERMPPADSHVEVTPYEIALIKKWIDQGADWKKHWSFMPVVRPDGPEVKQADWPKNEVDHLSLIHI